MEKPWIRILVRCLAFWLHSHVRVVRKARSMAVTNWLMNNYNYNYNAYVYVYVKERVYAVHVCPVSIPCLK